MTDIDHLVYQAHFGSDADQRPAHAELLKLARQQGCVPSSIAPVYRARGRGYIAPSFTVPAMNLRGLSYLTAQAAFEAAIELEVGLMIFELARSEMKYTGQNPYQFASSIIGAALKTGWRWPIFIQGDHYQPKAVSPGLMKRGEETAIKELIDDSLAAGFYNLDIDGSTLVDSTQPSEYDQQRPNFLFTAEMYRHILKRQPLGVSVALGCEIAEVGTHLSKSSQLSAFMTGLHDEGELPDLNPSKVAVETGTAHGGVVNRDGTAGEMKVDFNRLQTLSILARHKYHMAGAVQHGASTLSKEIFTRFPEAEAAEIHLSTGFQNTILGHPNFPQGLIDEMYEWCDKNCFVDRKPDWSDAQFYAKSRKKAWGPFKQQTWDLPVEIQTQIKDTLKSECQSYFINLGVRDTLDLMRQWLTF